jgi:hypothetical protein
MSQLLRFPTAVKRDPAIEAWMLEHAGELGAIAERWFAMMRECGDDVRELLHDGHPTACVGDAAFGYVNGFTAHVNATTFEDPARCRGRVESGRQSAGCSHGTVHDHCRRDRGSVQREVRGCEPVREYTRGWMIRAGSRRSRLAP